MEALESQAVARSLEVACHKDLLKAFFEAQQADDSRWVGDTARFVEGIDHSEKEIDCCGEGAEGQEMEELGSAIAD